MIPPEYRKNFRDARDVLHSHRGWDAGALVFARQLSAALKCPLICSETSRLLVDLNRSLHHHHLFSVYTRTCDDRDKSDIIKRFYQPYRDQIRKTIHRQVQQGRFVLHLSAHSFAPVLSGITRNADIGLLYDPARRYEKTFCRALHQELKTSRRVRLNYPYRGTADGLTTWLRKQFREREYCGIELEINQGLVNKNREWKKLKGNIINAVQNIIAELSS